jgi:hypothetical protein
VLYAALQPDCYRPPVVFPRPVRATFFRWWIKFQQLFEQFIELFTQQLFKWIQFVERSLIGRLVFLKQSQSRRIGFAQLQFRISGVTFERAPFPLWRGRRDP